MIEMNGVRVNYGASEALKGLSFAVKPGEVMCLLGANGAGKSTALNVLLGFVAPAAGQALIAGTDVAVEPRKTKASLMYLPEQVNLYEDFNALENIRYLAELSQIAVADAEIEAALQQAGLQQSAWQQPLSDYSKGMRQKVGIAFAIVKKAVALLLDEPTSGLDPSATLEFIQAIKQLASQGAAILMVTHDLYCAHCLANRIGIMREGQLMELVQRDSVSLPELESLYHGTVAQVAAV